jgi:UDP-N-acetylglucosamine diphosphorylase / glucose-1-phosphate thymidylyltransferase / UDP-N-acetylgalactosamine diphosphorylase / glucosamine-1-phosphate N-acetyltransferase / galactosamine-1-phosphate N-acetyltransferase
MAMHVVIFEGHRWPSFAPLSLSRPVFALRCGMSTLLDQQIRRLAPSRLTLWVRPKLADYCRHHLLPTLPIPTKINEPLDNELTLLCSGRSIHLLRYEWPQEASVVLDETNVIRQALVRAPGLSPEDCLLRSPAWMKLADLPQAPLQSRLPNHIWDLTQWNEESLVADSIDLRDEAEEHPAGPYHMVHEEDVHLASVVSLAPGVVLDASRGPIIIDAGCSIGANSVVEGPCHIGSGTAISPLSLIRGGTSIGPGCKIGGEVSSSIIMANTNKAHYGFLGDSYVGEWVNLGAGTTTSNLKNTYGAITMRIGPQEIPTERRFLGSMIGDHTKTAIGTRLMTGSYVGFCSLLAGSTLPPKYIPSFTFWTDKGAEKYRLDKAREVMKQVIGRRGKEWAEQDQFMLDYVAATAPEVEGV